MEENNQHFPEDLDAPHIKESFYHRNKKQFDYAVFGLLILTTAVTVSFSIYIIVSKYF